MRIQQIKYDPKTERLMFDGDGLHCGEVLECAILQGNEIVWEKVSFELSDTWYIPKHKDIDPIGLWARKI